MNSFSVHFTAKFATAFTANVSTSSISETLASSSSANCRRTSMASKAIENSEALCADVASLRSATLFETSKNASLERNASFAVRADSLSRMNVTQHSSRGGMSTRHSNEVAKRSERNSAAASLAAMRDVRFVFTLSLLFFFFFLPDTPSSSLSSSSSSSSVSVFAHNTGCVATVKMSKRYGLINFASWSSQNASIAESVADKTTKAFSGVSPFLAAALLEHI